jgi:hypothetical protein
MLLRPSRQGTARSPMRALILVAAILSQPATVESFRLSSRVSDVPRRSDCVGQSLSAPQNPSSAWR